MSDEDDPLMAGYVPREGIIDTSRSSRRIRDTEFERRKEEIKFSTAQLTFDERGTGTESPAQVVVLTNTGYGDVHIFGSTLTGDFVVKSPIPSRLQPGEHAAIQIAFAPTTIGQHIGSLYIDTGDAAGDELVALSGSAVAGDLGIAPTDDIQAILKMTQSEYNALDPKDPQTLYIIVG